MWVFFGDENLSSPISVRSRIFQVFLLAGYAIRQEHLHPLLAGMEQVKNSVGLQLRHPVKYNLRDSGVTEYFEQRGEAALLASAITQADPLRLGLLNLLKKYNAKTFACVLGGLGFVGKREYYTWAAANLLQRIGWLANPTAVHPDLLVCLDWPMQKVGKAYFEVYHTPWHDGRSLEGHPFSCGTLRHRKAFPDIVVSSTIYNPYLQLADIVTGATMDFVNWTLTKNHRQRVDTFFPPVADAFHRVTGYALSQTTFVSAPPRLKARIGQAYTEVFPGRTLA